MPLWILRGLLRALAGLALAAAALVVLALAVAAVRGSEPWRAIAIAFYVGAALAISTAVFSARTLTLGTYAENSAADAIKASNEAKAVNLLLGLGLIGLGILVETLTG